MENKKTIEIDINLLSEVFKNKLDLQAEGNFEIINLYNLPEEKIISCFYNYNEFRKNILKENMLSEIILLLFHYNMEEEIAEILFECLKFKKKLDLNPKIEQIFLYSKMLEATENTVLACENNFIESLKIAHQNNEKFSRETTIAALKNENFESFKYLYDNSLLKKYVFIIIYIFM